MTAQWGKESHCMRLIDLEGDTNFALQIGRPWRVKSLGFVCSPSFFSLPAACRIFSRGVIFTHAGVSLALQSLRKNGGLLVVYPNTDTAYFNHIYNRFQILMVASI